MKVDLSFDTEQFRQYAKTFIDVYVNGADRCNLPVDKENLESVVGNAEITGYVDEASTATFSVNRKSIKVISNNFKKNGIDRANYLLLHEYTHLNNPINLELYEDQMGLFNKFQDRANGFNNPNVSGFNATMVLLLLMK